MPCLQTDNPRLQLTCQNQGTVHASIRLSPLQSEGPGEIYGLSTTTMAQIRRLMIDRAMILILFSLRPGEERGDPTPHLDSQVVDFKVSMEVERMVMTKEVGSTE